MHVEEVNRRRQPEEGASIAVRLLDDAARLPRRRCDPRHRGLVNPRGFVIVDKHQRNPKYPNVFGIGVCVAIPPMGGTALPWACPRPDS